MCSNVMHTASHETSSGPNSVMLVPEHVKRAQVGDGRPRDKNRCENAQWDSDDALTKTMQKWCQNCKKKSRFAPKFRISHKFEVKQYLETFIFFCKPLWRVKHAVNFAIMLALIKSDWFFFWHWDYRRSNEIADFRYVPNFCKHVLNENLQFWKNEITDKKHSYSSLWLVWKYRGRHMKPFESLTERV